MHFRVFSRAERRQIALDDGRNGRIAQTARSLARCDEEEIIIKNWMQKGQCNREFGWGEESKNGRKRR